MINLNNMNPNTPQLQPNNTSAFGPQPEVQAQPIAQPMAQPGVQPQVQFVQPAINDVPSVAQPVVAQQPLEAPQQFPQSAAQQAEYSQPMTTAQSKILALLDEKSGILSLALFGVAFAILSIATIIHVNNILADVKSAYVAYNMASQVPTLFDMTKEMVLNWVFVNGLSAWWWVLSFIPALGVAGYGIYKNRLKNIFAIITVALVAEVYLNLIIK